MQETASTEAAAAMKINPCDREDSRVGATLAWLTDGTDCRCCIGARIVLALIVGLAVGVAIGKHLG